MRRALIAAAAATVLAPAAAQEAVPGAESLPEAAAPQGAVTAAGATLRWLDKMSGATGDMQLGRGEAGRAGRLTVTLDDCRFPAGGVPTDAYAHLTVHDSLRAGAVFSGWMIAAAPALNAMDHPRYDVWVLRCLTAEGEGQ
jgi:hypothetical protein